MRWPWQERGEVPTGFTGIGGLVEPERERPTGGGDIPPPGGLPPASDDGSFMVRVWVHERADGEQFVHPDMVIDLLRGLMRGPAASAFLTTFEAALYRLLVQARRNARRIQVLPKQQEVATVSVPAEVEEQK